MAVTVMQRYELKYLLDAEHADYLRRRIEGRLQTDAFGRTSIASLYYDTPDFRLIRASLEKPAFKEKIRLRSYGSASAESPVYLELKRKADGVVYKRRVQSVIPEADRFFAGEDVLGGDRQIRKEITRFRDFYRTLIPACLIICDRTAYYEPGGDLRLTIDERPRYRMEELALAKSMEGQPLLEDGRCILEVKLQGAMPLWLSSVLSEGEIFRSSFSKYGEAYRQKLAETKENSFSDTASKLPDAA